MIMKYTFLAIILTSIFTLSCGSESGQTNVAADTRSPKDSLKAQVADNLPPSEDFKQFEWIYSSFVAAATYTVKSTDVFVNKEAGIVGYYIQWGDARNGTCYDHERIVELQK